MNYLFLKLTVGVIATLGLYSVLYRETRFYRLFEHVFLGLAVGWSCTALWTETLHQLWYSKMIGSAAENGNVAIPGMWAYAILLPIGLMAYLVFSQKHNWISRIPIGIILGLWAGQQVQVWWNRYGDQIGNSIRPIIPNQWDSLLHPGANAVPNGIYVTQAFNNIVFTVTLLCVMSYFLFSFEIKNKFVSGMTVWGRWLLMVGFGAIFGSTVMTRFTLLIDRMYFVWIEWFRDTILPMVGM
ncbi:MAG TPA: hypothetical protein PLX06_15785 [Fimbriimonadaceae bacterium]|nr:hypothetical protein [Fimbriimonadaceae bacterium]